MPYTQEKRCGKERRNKENGQPKHNERRSVTDRRQTNIEEISYFEWASHFVKFQSQQASGKPASMAENSHSSNTLRSLATAK
jgi:hypothetical protein